MQGRTVVGVVDRLTKEVGSIPVYIDQSRYIITRKCESCKNNSTKF